LHRATFENRNTAAIGQKSSPLRPVRSCVVLVPKYEIRVGRVSARRACNRRSADECAAQAFARRVGGGNPKSGPQNPDVLVQPPRPLAPDHSWMGNLDELIKLLMAVAGGGQVIVTPLPAEWLRGSPPPAPPEPAEPEETEYMCPGGWPENDCTA
jgi:hypothetical protein